MKGQAHTEDGKEIVQNSTIERITTALWRRYVVAVLIIATSLIFSHSASMNAIQRSDDASTAIKLTANQRMLSQRIMFLATDAIMAENMVGFISSSTELERAVEQFEDTHYALLWGGRMGLSKEGAEQRRHIFYETIDNRSLAVLVPAFVDLGKYVQSGTLEDRLWALNRMEDFGRNMLLSRLDIAVEGMEKEAKVIVDRLRTLSWVSLGVALAILAAEMLLIFRPAHVLVHKTLMDLGRSQKAQTQALRRAEEAQQETEAALASQSKFFGYMSHELRTPLNGIIGMLSLLKDELPEADRRRYLFHATAAAEHLLKILGNVLDLSRLETGMMSVEEAPFKPTEVIETAVQLFEGQANVKGLQLTFGCEEGTTQEVMGDRARVLQVVTNLVGNAVKFTDEGEVQVRLMKEQDVQAPGLVIEVADTGPGLDPEAIPKMFDDFVTSKLTAEKSAMGSGLGLSICRQLVEKMGGRIWAENRPEGGSVFRFSLPLEPAHADDEQGRDSKPQLEDRPVLEDCHVLIVDDNEANRLVAQAFVKSLGGKATLAVDGKEAVAICAKQCSEEDQDLDPFDLILMDQRMPEMDGLTATTRIRAMAGDAGKEIPILISSANISDEDRENAFKAGAAGFLPKPLRRAALIEAAHEQIKWAQPRGKPEDDKAA